MDIVAGLASLDTALKIAKAMREVDRAYDQVALKGQVVDLMGALYDVKGQLMDAAESIRERDAEIKRLADALAGKEALTRGPGGYFWIDQGDGLRLGYPVCPACLESEGRQVELKQDGAEQSAKCPRCESKFVPVESFMAPDAAGHQITATERREAERAERLRRDSAALRRLGDNNWM